MKDCANFVAESGKDPESKKKAQEGRNLHNEGRLKDGKPPKTTPPAQIIRKSNDPKARPYRRAFCCAITGMNVRYRTEINSAA
jgi:hypothetical protein